MRLVIYHAGCLDGAAAAGCAYLKFGDDAEYLPIQYHGMSFNEKTKTLSYKASQERHSWKKELTSDAEVFVLDMSFPIDVTEALIESGVRFVWLDHHKTAIDGWTHNRVNLSASQNVFNVLKNSEVILDMSRSGAQISWDYFFGTTRPRMIDYVGDRDLWKFELPDTKAICEGLYHQRPWDVRLWVHLLSDSFDEKDLKDAGNVLLREANNRVRAALSNARSVKIFDTLGLASNSPTDVSLLGQELALESHTFGLVWSMRNDGKIICSFRSIGFDVASLARRLGGGGHKSAAGCVTDLKSLTSWMEAGVSG